MSVVIVATATDRSNNLGRALNASFMVDKNDNATCVQNSTPSFNTDSGSRSLLPSISCSDAEGDAVNIENNSVDTGGLASGDYSQDITVSDTFSSPVPMNITFTITAGIN